MAFVFDPNKDKDKQTAQGQAPQGPQTLSSGEGSAITSPAQTKSPAQQKASASGRFTNIQSFIKANDPSQLAGQVTGKIGEEKGKAVGQLNEAKSAVDKSAQATGEAIAASKAKLQGAQQGLQGAYTAQGGPVGEEQFGQGLEAFKQGLGMQYTGVDDLGNQGNLKAQAQNLQELGQATQSATGRSQLLQRFFGNPQYAGGQRTLDTVLLGSQRPKLQQAAAQANVFGGELDTARRQALSQIAQSRQGVQDVVGETKKAIEGQIGEAKGSIAERATQAQSIRDLLRKQDSELQITDDANLPSITGDKRTDLALKNALDQGFMTPEQVEQFKGMQSRIQNAGFNARDLLSGTLLTGDETGEQLQARAASKQQAERASKLQSLLGQNTAYNPYEYSGQNMEDALSLREDYLNDALVQGGFATPGETDKRSVIANAAKLGIINPMAAQAYLAAAAYDKVPGSVKNVMSSTPMGASVGGAANVLSNKVQGLGNALVEDPKAAALQALKMQLNPAESLKFQTRQAFDVAQEQKRAAEDAARRAMSAISSGFGKVRKLFSDANLKQNIQVYNTKAFLDTIQPYQYNYINKDHGEGTYISPMAQDLEKTPEGKALVVDTPEGKMVDYSRALGLIMATLGDINTRLIQLEQPKDTILTKIKNIAYSIVRRF